MINVRNLRVGRCLWSPVNGHFQLQGRFNDGSCKLKCVFNCRDDLSDTSSIASQQSGSYDPNRTEFNDGLTRLAQQGDAIPTSIDDADTNDGGIQLISAKTKPGE